MNKGLNLFTYRIIHIVILYTNINKTGVIYGYVFAVANLSRDLTQACELQTHRREHRQQRLALHCCPAVAAENQAALHQQTLVY